MERKPGKLDVNRQREYENHVVRSHVVSFTGFHCDSATSLCLTRPLILLVILLYTVVISIFSFLSLCFFCHDFVFFSNSISLSSTSSINSSLSLILSLILTLYFSPLNFSLYSHYISIIYFLFCLVILKNSMAGHK